MPPSNTFHEKKANINLQFPRRSAITNFTELRIKDYQGTKIAGENFNLLHKQDNTSKHYNKLSSMYQQPQRASIESVNES
jgi:hypothetical protein